MKFVLYQELVTPITAKYSEGYTSNDSSYNFKVEDYEDNLDTETMLSYNTDILIIKDLK